MNNPNIYVLFTCEVQSMLTIAKCRVDRLSNREQIFPSHNNCAAAIS